MAGGRGRGAPASESLVPDDGSEKGELASIFFDEETEFSISQLFDDGGLASPSAPAPAFRMPMSEDPVSPSMRVPGGGSGNEGPLGRPSTLTVPQPEPEGITLPTGMLIPSVPNFFGEETEFSFSQLFAGGLVSPLAPAPAPAQAPAFRMPMSDDLVGPSMRVPGGGSGYEGPLGWPSTTLTVPQPAGITLPTGIRPSILFQSPATLFPSGPGVYGAPHQQYRAQDRGQAARSHSYPIPSAEHLSSVLAEAAATVAALRRSTTSSSSSSSSLSYLQDMSVLPSNAGASTFQDVSHGSQSHSHLAAPAVDTPVDDGYRWRKYGERQVKGCESPRTYYKCTHPTCPVRKTVDRSLDGRITETIHKGQHDHQPPRDRATSQQNPHPSDGYRWRKYGEKQVKGCESPRSYYKCTHPTCPVRKTVHRSLDGHVTEIIHNGQHDHQPPRQANRATDGELIDSGLNEITCERDRATSQPNPHPTSDDEELGAVVAGGVGTSENESELTRRNTDAPNFESLPHRTATEPEMSVRGTSEVDLLDDGYSWRIYRKRLLKGHLHPRSYYSCTNSGCNARKHVERAPDDPKDVITTYEGKHNHEIPAARDSGQSFSAVANVIQPQVLNPSSGTELSLDRGDSVHNVQGPIGGLPPEEEEAS